MLEQILFWLLAAGAVVSTLMVVVPIGTGRNPLYAALMLVVSFVFMAGLYVLLLAHLMAALQVLVYAGAIMVLFIFVIMLLNLSDKELGKERMTAAKSLGLMAIAFILFKTVSVVLTHGNNINSTAENVRSDGVAVLDTGFGTVETVGDLLFRQFLMPFELTSILLLIAIAGAVVLAKRTLS